MVLNEIKEIDRTDFDDFSSGIPPSDGPGSETVPLGQINSYITRAVPDDTFPLYARVIGFSGQRTRSFLLSQLQLFSYAAGRDLTTRECDIMIGDDVNARRTSSNIMAGAVGLGLVHLARSHQMQRPVLLQHRFPAAYSNINTFGPLKGAPARAAWSSIRLAVYLPLWVVGAQLLVFPMLGLAAVRAAKNPELRKMNEEVRRGIDARMKRGVAIGTMVAEADRAARRSQAAASNLTGDGPGMFQQQTSDDRRAGQPSSIGNEGAVGPSYGRWKAVAANSSRDQPDSLDSMLGPDPNAVDSASPVARGSPSFDHGAVETRSWDQVRRGAKSDSSRGGGGGGTGSSSVQDDRQIEDDTPTNQHSWDDIRRASLAMKKPVRRDD